MQRKPACACQSTQRKLACSQCGQRDFSNLDDLEAHIVEQHFSNIDGYYECLYPKCSLLFPTELVYLKHEFDVHLKGNLASNQMKERCFVIQRLKIHNLLNESINFSFSDHPGSNGNNIQHPTTTTHVPVMRPMLLLKKRAYNIQNEPSRNERVETIALQGQAQPSSEREQQTFYNTSDAGMKRTKPQGPSNLAINLDRLFESDDVTRSTTADASVSKLRQSGMDNSGPNDKNKETERENSSILYVVKDEPSDELTQNIPASSNQMLALGNTDSIGKDNGTIEPETSSKSSVVKDEPSLMDELTSTIPAASNRIDKLILGNADSIGKNNENIEPDTSSKPPVIKEEPSLMDELASTIPASLHSPHSSKQQANSGSVNSSRFPENLISSERVEHANSVVKDEPIPIDELIAVTAVLPNNNGSSSSNFEFAALSRKPKGSRKQNFTDLDLEHIKRTQLHISSNPSVIKDEPNLIDQLAADIPGPSNYADILTSLTSESAPPPQKTKRSRKQNFADLYPEDNKHTHPLTSSNPSVDKVEPSLIDQLAADIPGPSNHVYYLTSDDDLRVIKPKKRKLFTEEQKNIIVRLRARGDSLYDIAKIVGCSTGGVGFFLRRYRETGSIENALPNPIPRPPIKVTQEIIEAITENAKKDPWSTATDDIEMIKDRFNVSISASTAREVRNKYGLNRYTKY